MKNATILGITALGAHHPCRGLDDRRATEGVSPGALDRMAQVNNACPTFSWDGEARRGHERDSSPTPSTKTMSGDSAELTADTEVLYARVPGGASSWTPSADQCFAPGGRYVWFVRAVSELAGDQVDRGGRVVGGTVFHRSGGAIGRGDAARRWMCCGGGTRRTEAGR